MLSRLILTLTIALAGGAATHAIAQDHHDDDPDHDDSHRQPRLALPVRVTIGTEAGADEHR